MKAPRASTAKVVVDPNALTRLAAHQALLELDDPPYLALRNLAYEEYNLPHEHAYSLRNGYVIHFILNQKIERGEVIGDILHMDLKVLDPPDQTQRPDEREMLAFEHQLGLLVESGQAVMPTEAEGINVKEVQKHAAGGKISNGQTGAARPRPQQPKATPPAVEPEVEEETQEAQPGKYPPISGSKRTPRGVSKAKAPVPKEVEEEEETQEAAGEADEADAGDEDADNDDETGEGAGEGDEDEDETPPTPPSRRGAPKPATPAAKPVAAAPRAAVTAATPRLATPMAKAVAKPPVTVAAAPRAATPIAKAATPVAQPPAGTLSQGKIDQLFGGVMLLVEQVKEANGKLDENAKEMAELRDSNAYLTKRVADTDALLCYFFRRSQGDAEGNALIEESPEELTAEATMTAYGFQGPQ